MNVTRTIARLGAFFLWCMGLTADAAAAPRTGYCIFEDIYGEKYFSAVFAFPKEVQDIGPATEAFNQFLRKKYKIESSSSTPRCNYYVGATGEEEWARVTAFWEKNGNAKVIKTGYSWPDGVGNGGSRVSDAALAAMADPNSAPGLPLTFVVTLGLNAPINGRNGHCFSKPITIPGPPGWRVKGSSAGTMAARALIEPYRVKMTKRCAEKYPIGRSPAEYQWNESDESLPEREYQAMVKAGQAQISLD